MPRAAVSVYAPATLGRITVARSLVRRNPVRSFPRRGRRGHWMRHDDLDGQAQSTVAMEPAITAGWRITGFSISGPRMMSSVASSARASST